VSPEASAAGPLPKVRGGPPTFFGTGAVPAAGAGAEPKTLPGCEKASGSVFPQMLPIATNVVVQWVRGFLLGYHKEQGNE
jgi:hypothetical protein